jgi:hypothetical protein
MSPSTSDSIVAPFVARQLSASYLDDSIWSDCQPIQITKLWNGKDAVAQRHAEARVCWTDEALVTRFVGQQTEELVVSSTPVLDRKTLGLWDRDVCEVFVAPAVSKPERYYEFEASPSGEWVDLGLLITPSGRETDWDFASGMTTESSLEENQIIVGIKIPWSVALPKPQKGATWRANFFRCISLDPIERYLAWRPTYAPEPNFHVPEAFGTLYFE